MTDKYHSDTQERVETIAYSPVFPLQLIVRV